MTFKRLIAAIALACLLGLTTFGEETIIPPCSLGEVGTSASDLGECYGNGRFSNLLLLVAAGDVVSGKAFLGKAKLACFLRPG